VLAQIDVRRGEAVKERFALHARPSHLGEHVIVAIWVAGSDLPDALDHGSVELEGRGLSGPGDAEHEDQAESAWLHRIELAGMK
jgi:hypothetical protein